MQHLLFPWIKKYCLLINSISLQINLFAQDVMFNFNLVATKVLEYSFRENYFWVSQVMRVQLQETYCRVSQVIGMLIIFWLLSNQMRGITSPISRPHCHRQRSHWIEALMYTDLTQCNEHYRRRHWSIATVYNLLLSRRLQASHCQCCPPPLGGPQKLLFFNHESQKTKLKSSTSLAAFTPRKVGESKLLVPPPPSQWWCTLPPPLHALSLPCTKEWMNRPT